MTEDPIVRLRDELDQIEPSAAARSRMLQRVDRHAAAATKHRLPRRVPRLALGSIAAVAVVIGLVVALGPGGSGDDDASHGVPAFVGPDTAAARELVRAGDAAADAPWGPLGDGEYYRLYSTSIPGRSDRASSQPTSYELWMDRDGRGQNLYVMGATDPSRYPMLHGSSIGFNTSPAKHPVSLEEQLRQPNSVNLSEWGVDRDDARQRGWARQRQGYVSIGDSNKPGSNGSYGSPERTMRVYWGVTTKEIDALPDIGGPDMDRAIEQLLRDLLRDDLLRSNRIPTGAFGVTQEMTDREEQIELAVRLLGTAPLPPEARRSLYRWLAKQPGAAVEQDAKDALGRTGVRITFTDQYHEQVPARTVTAKELVHDAIEAGAKLDPDVHITMMDIPKTNAEMLRRQHEDLVKDVSPERRFSVPAHTEVRTWRVVFVVDPDSGQLLQWSDNTTKRASEVIPELMRPQEDGVVQIIESGGRGSMEQMTGSWLYVARDRARLDEPETLVCRDHPEVCGLDK